MGPRRLFSLAAFRPLAFPQRCTAVRNAPLDSDCGPRALGGGRRVGGLNGPYWRNHDVGRPSLRRCRCFRNCGRARPVVCRLRREFAV